MFLNEAKLYSFSIKVYNGKNIVEMVNSQLAGRLRKEFAFDIT